MSLIKEWLTEKMDMDGVKKDWDKISGELGIDIPQDYWDKLDALEKQMVEGDEV